MRIGSTTLALTALAFSLAAAACGGGQPASDSGAAPAAPVTNPVDPATAGAVAGKVTFMGTPPPAETISMSSDPRCVNAGAKTEAVVVAGDGSLQNVFVYVKDGLGALKFPVPATPLVLDQKGCQYRPARLRRAGRPADRDPQQRRHAAQHPRVAAGQRRVQHGPGAAGHEGHARLQHAAK